jgi:hypothetical protein
LEKRAEQVLPGSKRDWGTGNRWRAGGINGPNNVCTYEHMNKEKRNKRKIL